MILVATWEDGLFAVSGSQRMQQFAKQPVRGLAPDGRGGAIAIIGGHSVSRRGADGSWETVATSALELSCCMAVRDAIYAGTDDARLLRLRYEGGEFEEVAGFSRVAGRETWFAGGALVNGRWLGPPLGIRSVASNADGSVLFANVHVGGIPRSTDGGETWQPTINIHYDVHQVCGHPTDANLIAAASAVGLCISRDAGATWSVEAEGLHGLHCTAVAFSGDDILVSAATDHFAAQGRIYRRTSGPAGALTAVEGGLPEWLDGIVDTGGLAINGSTIVLADRGGNLYSSLDCGWNWSPEAARVPAPSGVLLCH